MRKAFALIAITAILCGCVNIEYTGKTAPRQESDAQIAVFTDPARITRPYTVLGSATASGDYREVSTQNMINKLREKAAECGANAILITDHRVIDDDHAAVVSNPVFMTSLDYNDTDGGDWRQIYADVDRNFVNPYRNFSTTTGGSANNFRRVIRAEFLLY
ncbi:MAG: hypothetical protein E7053_06250 [Lentisphaerae bacterium]|nr:hypothetical protein [Lentisphaerota bacterium]